MRCFKDDIKLNDNEKTAVALGKFDGIHLGHATLIREITSCNKYLSSLVFTFDRSPDVVFAGRDEGYILTMEERRKKLSKMGVDILVEYPFTKEFAALEPVDFVKHILIDRLHIKMLTVGADFCFGKGRSGNVSLLRELSKKYDFELNVFDKLSINGEIVSSTLIRDNLKQGRLSLVEKYLGEPYTIFGVVVNGKRLGRTIGFPTANIVVSKEKLLPPYGVYRAEIKTKDETFYGIADLGIKPTVSDDETCGLETYIFDFDRDIYGETIEVRLKEFIRPEMRFDSVDELVKQIKKDVETAKA
ncbi:MAG: bifunctional riboflavin kinase/FAD synthetase [Lachnospiraceae bacterium]|nr:bifunctional riboflavin kinase/FAD synthetase [Lachnospiraceae bacterium]